MRDPLLGTRELNVCAKFQVRSSKTVAATLWTNKHIYIHRTYRQKVETGETGGKPKYVAGLRTRQYTVHICETVQFSDEYWFVKGTGQWKGTGFPLSVSTYRQKGETGETRGKPIQICETVQFSDEFWFVKSTGQLKGTGFPVSVSIMMCHNLS